MTYAYRRKSHPRESGGPLFGGLDSRLRGNDGCGRAER